MAKRIAIVEDDPDQRANYTDAITNKGYQVSAYGSRQEALEGFDRELPDLVILDIILGEEVDAGFQLCRDLLARAPSLPVIFLLHTGGGFLQTRGLLLGTLTEIGIALRDLIGAGLHRICGHLNFADNVHLDGN